MRKLRIRRLFIGLFVIIIFVVGVPIIINECYKTNSGYMTMWDAADVLAYYGTILGALVAVATVVVTILFTYKQIQRDSYFRRENEKWFNVESVFSNALNTINLMPPLIETMEINGIEPTEAIKQIQRYQVNANICLDQILTSLDSADYRKVRTLSNSMERAREKFCQVMQNRAEIYEKLFRVNEKEIAERILEVEKQEQKSLPIRVRMRCQEAVARAHGLNFDELKIELEQLNEATAKMHADIFRPLLQLKQRTFELIRTELSQKADRILNFGGDTHANT